MEDARVYSGAAFRLLFILLIVFSYYESSSLPKIWEHVTQVSNEMPCTISPDTTTFKLMTASHLTSRHLGLSVPQVRHPYHGTIVNGGSWERNFATTRILMLNSTLKLIQVPLYNKIPAMFHDVAATPLMVPLI